MNKEKYLTARWNNMLSFGLGIPALAFTIFALVTSIMSPFSEFIGMAAIGVVY